VRYLGTKRVRFFSPARPRNIYAIIHLKSLRHKGQTPLVRCATSSLVITLILAVAESQTRGCQPAARTRPLKLAQKLVFGGRCIVELETLVIWCSVCRRGVEAWRLVWSESCDNESCALHMTWNPLYLYGDLSIRRSLVQSMHSVLEPVKRL